MITPENRPTRHRRSIRLAGYDYSAEGGCYITMVTHHRKCLFGEIIGGEMKLNEYGSIAKMEWLNTAKLRSIVELFEEEFVVMPNHVHGVIWLNKDPGWGTARCAPTTGRRFGEMVPNSVPEIVRAYKSAVTKAINTLRNTPGTPV